MTNIYLPEDKMFPNIRLIRLYDTEIERVLDKTHLRHTEEYELGLYLTNSGTIILEQAEHPIQRGLIRFSSPGDIVSSTPPYQCITIFFDWEGIDPHCHNELLDSIPTHFSTGSTYTLLFEEALRLFVSDFTGSKLRQTILLLHMLSSFYTQLHSSAQYSESVRTCVSYMENHFAEKITLAKLGSLTGYSTLHMFRLFKEDTGSTPHKFLSNIRMSYAKELLNNTNTPVSAIANACGFQSESHFQMLFKQHNHITPGQYRQNAKVFL